MPAVIAVAIVSMRSPEPDPPTIWPPSTRPVLSSTTSFTVIGSAEGR